MKRSSIRCPKVRSGLSRRKSNPKNFSNKIFVSRKKTAILKPMNIEGEEYFPPATKNAIGATGGFFVCKKLDAGDRKEVNV